MSSFQAFSRDDQAAIPPTTRGAGALILWAKPVTLSFAVLATMLGAHNVSVIRGARMH